MHTPPAAPGPNSEQELLAHQWLPETAPAGLAQTPTPTPLAAPSFRLSPAAALAEPGQKPRLSRGPPRKASEPTERHFQSSVCRG